MDTKADRSKSRDRPLLCGAGLWSLSSETRRVRYSKGAELRGPLPEEAADDKDDLLSIGLFPLSSVVYKSRMVGPSSTKLIDW